MKNTVLCVLWECFCIYQQSSHCRTSYDTVHSWNSNSYFYEFGQPILFGNAICLFELNWNFKNEVYLVKFTEKCDKLESNQNF